MPSMIDYKLLSQDILIRLYQQIKLLKSEPCLLNFIDVSNKFLIFSNTLYSKPV